MQVAIRKISKLLSLLYLKENYQKDEIKGITRHYGQKLIGTQEGTSFYSGTTLVWLPKQPKSIL